MRSCNGRRVRFAITIAAGAALGLVAAAAHVGARGGAPAAHAGGAHCQAAKGAGKLVAHEWGTFTTVAGGLGVALEWRPLEAEASDLPAFVYDTRNVKDGTRFPRKPKQSLEATVRMETPVVYFYSDTARQVSLSVRFKGGAITEWYPRARSVAGDGIDWGTFTVDPTAAGTVKFPTENTPSHYYPARATDAAPLKVCGTEGTEWEKFLFYRGVGKFDLPLSARVDGDQVVLTAGAAVGDVILFERRSDTLGWSRVSLPAGKTVKVPRPKLGGKLEPLLADLGKLLAAPGLYPAEVSAMLATWRDSWFEEGLRVIYVLPRAAVDAALPIQIDPQPDELVRVLVGRAELITPEMKREARALLESAGGDTVVRAALVARFGRFARAVLLALAEDPLGADEQARVQAQLADAP